MEQQKSLSDQLEEQLIAFAAEIATFSAELVDTYRKARRVTKLAVRNGAGAQLRGRPAGPRVEWVLDYFSKDYYATSPIRNPTGPASGSKRIVKGGSWNDNEDEIWPPAVQPRCW